MAPFTMHAQVGPHQSANNEKAHGLQNIKKNLKEREGAGNLKDVGGGKLSNQLSEERTFFLVIESSLL